MKTSHVVSMVVLFLGACTSVFAGDNPVLTLVWNQTGPGAGQAGSSGNVYYCGGVFNDMFYTGQLNWGALAYAKTQVGETPTALLREFKTAAASNNYNGARTTVLIGDYVFFNHNDKAAGKVHLNRLNSDWTNLVTFPTDNMGNDLAPEGMTTDGTSLFTTQSTSKNVIRKYSIENQAGSFTLTKTLNVAIDGAGTFRAMSHYNGKIYVVDNGAGKGIYEIDASTGAYTQLGTHIGATAYQAVRYGNRLFVVDGVENPDASNLTVYDITGGALGAGTPYNLHSLGSHMLGVWGIGVVGSGGKATGFWVNSSNGWVSFFSFTTQCNEPFADADADTDVDMDDFGVFQRCFTGSGGGLPEGPDFSYPCFCFDKNESTSVDDADFAAFRLCATGSAIQWAASEGCP